MFDVTRLSTFEAVQMWKQDLDNKVLLPNGKPIPAVLLANKVCFVPRQIVSPSVCDSVKAFIDFVVLNSNFQTYERKNHAHKLVEGVERSSMRGYIVFNLVADILS